MTQVDSPDGRETAGILKERLSKRYALAAQEAAIAILRRYTNNVNALTELSMEIELDELREVWNCYRKVLVLPVVHELIKDRLAVLHWQFDVLHCQSEMTGSRVRVKVTPGDPPPPTTREWVELANALFPTIARMV